MSQSLTVVVSDDEVLRNHLGTCLEFIGEHVVVQPPSAALPEGVSVVFAAGGVRVAIPSQVPVIAVGDAGTGLASEIGRLGWPPNASAVREALAAAERFHHRQPTDAARALRPCEIVGNGDTVAAIRERIAKVAAADVPVLLLGETGTGKALAAWAIHQASRRADEPFVPFDCAAVGGEVIESELFGREQGPLAGDHGSRQGRLELAQGGTLFLDKVGELPAALQVRVLRLIEDGTFERQGGTASLRADVRIVAATDCDLAAMTAAGRLREDLYFRLNVMPVELPPLRNRREDVPALISALAQRHARDGAALRLTAAAMERLAAYDWPGNVRELDGVVERLLVEHSGRVVDAADLPARFTGAGEPPRNAGAAHPVGLIDPDAPPLLPVNGIDLKDYMNRLERSLIQQALDDTGAVVARAADRLHIRRTTLVEKMRKHGLNRQVSPC